MCLSSPKVPKAPAAVPSVQEQDPAVQSAMDRERRRQAAALGRRSTLLTGGSGLTSPATTTTKTLLGE